MNSGDRFLKGVLDRLTLLSGIATVLVAILGFLFHNLGEQTAQTIAYLAACLLFILSSAIFYLKRRRLNKYSISDLLEPLAPTSALRGLLPFEEADRQLPGRSRDIQDLYTLVVNSTFRFGVMWGEPGCGKTSLLRAGLVPKLKEQDFLPIYIPNPGKNPIEAIQSVLKRKLPEVSGSPEIDIKELVRCFASKGKKVIFIFDQFEEFFLTNRTLPSRVRLAEWIGELITDNTLPLAFLLSIRADYFAQLQTLAPSVREPTSTRTTYQLKNFDKEQARQILREAARIDAFPIQAELINCIVSDLELDGFVRPAELQIVGTRLKRRNTRNINQYEVEGRARGILNSYISEEINQSGNAQLARIILRMMLSEDGLAKSPRDISLGEILRCISEVSVADHSKEIPKILDQFVTARILIHTEKNCYNLVHDYLAQNVRTVTLGVETQTERANRLLKRYIAEYAEDPHLRIPFGQLRGIRSNAARDLQASAKARELIRKSTLSAVYRTSSSLLAIPVILIFFLYLFAASSYYLSIRCPNDSYIESNVQYIKVCSGHPQLKVLPGFDNTVIETDFVISDLEEEFEKRVLEGQITGYWFQRIDGHQTWINLIAEHLVFDYKSWARVSRLVNSPQASDALVMILMHQKSARNETDFTFEGFELIYPQILTLDTIQQLIDKLNEPNNPTGMHTNVMESLVMVVNTNPRLASPDMIQSLIELYSNLNKATELRKTVIDSLEELVQAYPQAVTPEMTQSLVEIILDSLENDDLRSSALAALARIAQASPQAVTPVMTQSLVEIILDSLENDDLRSSALAALARIAQASPQAVTPVMTQSLADIIFNPQRDISLRSSATECLSELAQANPQTVPPGMIQSLADIVFNPQEDTSFSLRQSVAYTLFRIEQNDPKALTPDMIQSLVENIFITPEDNIYNEHLAEMLGNLIQNNPQVITPDMIKSKVDIIGDPQEDLEKRCATMFGLGMIVRASPQAVSPDMIQSMVDILVNIILSDQEDPYLIGCAEDYWGVLMLSYEHLVANYMIQSLVETILNREEDILLRRSMAEGIATLVENYPQSVTPDVVPYLFHIYTNREEDRDVRLNVGDCLDKLIETNPQGVSEELTQSLLDEIFDPREGDSMRLIAGEALVKILQTNPKAVSPNMVQKLIDILHDPKEKKALDSIEKMVLVAIIQTNPQATNEGKIPFLIDVILDRFEDDNLRSSALTALAGIAENDPQSVTPDQVQSLVFSIIFPENHLDISGSRPIPSTVDSLARIVHTHIQNKIPSLIQKLVIRLQQDDQFHPSYTDSDRAHLLAMLAYNNPQLVTPEIVLSLSDAYKKPSSTIYQRESTIKLFEKTATIKPDVLISQKESLLLLEDDLQLYQDILEILGLAEYTQAAKLRPTNGSELLITLIKTDQDSDERFIGSYALFLWVINHPDQEQTILEKIQVLRYDAKPHIRMAATRVFEMIVIYNLYEDAYVDKGQLKRAESILNSYLTYTSENHLKYAANAAMDKISQMKKHRP